MRLAGIAGDFGRTDCGAMQPCDVFTSTTEQAERERETDIFLRDEA